MTLMTGIFKFLEDGNWHSLEEIAKESGVPLEELSRHCETIAKHKIIEYDTAANTIRLGPEPMTWILHLKAQEKTEATWKKQGAATIIIPPKKGFRIQGTTIHNTTDQDLQLELKFNKKLKEIVITKA